MFHWQTLRLIGAQDLRYRGTIVPGKVFEVELTNGKMVKVWRSHDGQHYFCHGLTFGGKAAPGGTISPFTGEPVETILQGYYQALPDEQARPGDFLVWKGLAPESTPHSAILTRVRFLPGAGFLDDTGTRLQTKNGLAPEANLTLHQLNDVYSDAYIVYRRRQN